MATSFLPETQLSTEPDPLASTAVSFPFSVLSSLFTGSRCRRGESFPENARSEAFVSPALFPPSTHSTLLRLRFPPPPLCLSLSHSLPLLLLLSPFSPFYRRFVSSYDSPSSSVLPFLPSLSLSLTHIPLPFLSLFFHYRLVLGRANAL